MICVAPSKLAPCHFRDLVEGFQLQMFFLGQDVVHPAGNQLVKNGFERLPPEGLKATTAATTLKWRVK